MGSNVQNSTGSSKFNSKLVMAVAACSIAVVLVICAAVFFGGKANAVKQLENFDGSFLPAEESTRILESNAQQPLGEKIKVYDNQGTQVALNDIDPDSYSGFIATLTEDALSSERLQSAINDNIVRMVTRDIVACDSLYELSTYFTESDFRYIEPDYYMQIADFSDPETSAYVPKDPRYYSSIYINQNDLKTIKVPEVWSQGIFGKDKTGKNEKTVVAVMDTGLLGTGNQQAGHEDMDYTKVLEGVNCVTGSPYKKEETPDTQGHGTFVAGQIAAAHNEVGVAGIAPEVYIKPYKVFETSSGKVADFLKAAGAIEEDLKKKDDNDPDILSMSLSWKNPYSGAKEMFERLADAGLIIVAAAGNDANSVLNYPAALDSVIGVSATDKNGTFASTFSNFGEKNVFVAAPGQSIQGLSIDYSNPYKSNNGTSMACPEVSAVAALAKSVVPDLTQNDFKALIMETSVDKGQKGYDEYYGWGLINAENIIKKLTVPNGATSGKVSDSVSWYITPSTANDPNRLVLLPNGCSVGTMNLSADEAPPWNEYASIIESVYVARGVNAGTCLRNAFSGMTNVRSIDIANLDASSVTDCEGIFDGVTRLDSLKIGDSWSCALKFPNNAISCFVSWRSESDENFSGGTEVPSGAAEYSAVWNHTEVYKEGSPSAIEPTCTTAGRQPVSLCSVCEAELHYGETIPQLGHSFEIKEYELEDDHGVSIYKEECARCHLLNERSVNIPENIIDSGTTGTGVGWFIRDHKDNRYPGELVLYPTNGTSGSISSTYLNVPWYDYRNMIVSVYVSGTVYKTGGMGSWFAGWENLKSVHLANLDVSGVTTMVRLFVGSSNISSVNISGWDTSGVTSMSKMFYFTEKCNVTAGTSFTVDCGDDKITALDVSHLNTSSVTDMSYMFASCKGVKTLDVSNFNTAEVTNCSYMFAGCYSVTSLDVSNFNMGKCTNTSMMFAGCYGLETLKMFESIKPVNTSGMFGNCNSLKELDVSGFNMENVTNMNSMFSICASLEHINTSNFATPKCTDVDYLFNACASLKSLDISQLDTSNATGNIKLQLCTSLSKLNVGPNAASGLVFPNRDSSASVCNIQKWHCVESDEDYTFGDNVPASGLYVAAVAHRGNINHIKGTVNCEEDGSPNKYVCSKCNRIYLNSLYSNSVDYLSYVAPYEVPESVSALGHDYYGEITEDPTCTEDGEKIYTCQRCLKYYVEKVDRLGHVEVVDAAVEPTCEELGKTEGSHCSRCGEVFTKQQDRPALGHIEVADNAVAATCTTPGKTAGSHCSRCEKVIVAQQETEALGHDYAAEVIDEPTCEDVGHIAHTCSRCNDAYTEETSALGHVEKHCERIEPKCTTAGKEAGTYCTRCEKVLEGLNELSATGHTWSDAPSQEDVHASTCTRDGYYYEVYRCTACSEENPSKPRVRVEIKAPGSHSVTIIIPYVAPTCTKTGTMQVRGCSRCSAVLDDVKSIPKIDHNKVDQLTKATLSADGKIENKCTMCKEVFETTVIPKIASVKLAETSFTYDGMNKDISVTAVDSTGAEIPSYYYTLSFPTGTKDSGIHNCVVTFSGNYEGSTSLAFNIVSRVEQAPVVNNVPEVPVSAAPVAAAGSAVKQTKCAVKLQKPVVSAASCVVKWKKPTAKAASKITGYQVRYSTKSSMAGSKTKAVKGKMKTSIKLAKLKPNTKYYVQIRTYDVVGGKKYYSKWSAKKVVVIK